MKKTLLILALFLSIQNIFAQNETDRNSLLWKISGNGISSPSYIFGTIHLIPEKDYFFSDKMKEAFNECKTLALEIDIDIPLKEQMAIAQKAIIPDNKTVENFMTSEEFNDYKSYIIDSLKIKESRFNQIQRIKPIFSVGIILNDMLENPVAYEKKLNKMADKNKMNIVGLETIEYQINILDSIDIQTQVSEIFVKNLHSNPLEEYKLMLDIYKSQNVDKLIEISQEDEFFTKIENNLVTKRNNNWIPIIKSLISKNSTFIAVGSAHLSGKNGILEKLKNEGYTITPVK
jgi:uncharacterized protein YbaP (TraB family)